MRCKVAHAAPDRYFNKAKQPVEEGLCVFLRLWWVAWTKTGSKRNPSEKDMSKALRQQATTPFGLAEIHGHHPNEVCKPSVRYLFV